MFFPYYFLPRIFLFAVFKKKKNIYRSIKLNENLWTFIIYSGERAEAEKRISYVCPNKFYIEKESPSLNTYLSTLKFYE